MVKRIIDWFRKQKYYRYCNYNRAQGLFIESYDSWLARQNRVTIPNRKKTFAEWKGFERY